MRLCFQAENCLWSTGNKRIWVLHCTLPREQPEFSSVTFHPCESRWRPPAALGTGSLPSLKENTHPNTGARRGQENLAWPRPHWLSCFPGLALQHLLPEGFLLSHNNYLKILKFLAASGDASRSQGINCHMQFPIPCPEPAWLNWSSSVPLFAMEITAMSSCWHEMGGEHWVLCTGLENLNDSHAFPMC